MEDSGRQGVVRGASSPLSSGQLYRVCSKLSLGHIAKLAGYPNYSRYVPPFVSERSSLLVLGQGMVY